VGKIAKVGLITSGAGGSGQVFFFEKKKQKTFACLASAFPERLGPDP
jgi:hypothetical protein